VIDAQFEVAGQRTRLDRGQPVQWDGLAQALAHIQAVGNEVTHRLGTFRPREGLPMSPLSGPPPSQELRRDAEGRPELPAENVAYLGRSLFSDYLIAVELAGTLLLVATIGAIAIAHRRQAGEGSP
jgi:hypothetical protein